jgi:hypothetical protein
MREADFPRMQRDPAMAVCRLEHRRRPVLAVSFDGQPSIGKLDPQLMTPAGSWTQLEFRATAQAFQHPIRDPRLLTCLPGIINHAHEV